MGPQLRFRSSVLLKSVVAVLLALALSTAVTAVTFSRLTRSALAEQSNELGRGQRSILEEAYNGRERQLVVNLRNLTQILVAQGLFTPDKRPNLIAELGRAAANLELDLLTVVDGRGRLLSPPVAVGLTLAAPEIVPKMRDDGLRSRLVRVSDGTFVQATAAPLPLGNEELIVVGGYSFDDEFAYSLRKQVGSHDDVLLVASGHVVG
ncbi:MAG: hypothetical protein M3326_03015, partial [Actinomycetota bacterium]|nr:hypothetical protein [Actinomycetota bacterium]